MCFNSECKLTPRQLKNKTSFRCTSSQDYLSSKTKSASIRIWAFVWEFDAFFIVRISFLLGLFVSSRKNPVVDFLGGLMAASAASTWGGCTLHIAALATAQHCTLQAVPQWGFGPRGLHVADIAAPPWGHIADCRPPQAHMPAARAAPTHHAQSMTGGPDFGLYEAVRAQIFTKMDHFQ